MRVRGGNGIKICMHKHTASGGMPPRKFLYFRLFQIASGAFSGICSSIILYVVLKNTPGNSQHIPSSGYSIAMRIATCIG